MNTERAKAIANVIVEMVLFLNAILIACDRSPLPIDADAITVTISAIFAGADAVWCWWKNQNITAEAQTAQRLADEMKADRELIGGEGDPLGDARGRDNDWE